MYVKGHDSRAMTSDTKDEKASGRTSSCIKRAGLHIRNFGKKKREVPSIFLLVI